MQNDSTNTNTVRPIPPPPLTNDQKLRLEWERYQDAKDAFKRGEVPTPEQVEAFAKFSSKDGRSVTSAENGRKHTGPDILALCEEYEAEIGALIRYRAGEFWLYDATRGFYVTRTRDAMAENLSAWLQEPARSSRGVFSKHTITEMLTAFTREDKEERIRQAPCFLSTGKSASHFLVVGNGLLDLEAVARGESNVLRPWTPDCLTRVGISTAYKPEAKCPRWKKALKAWLPEAHIRDAVQITAGYAVATQDTTQQHSAVNIGPPGGAKSSMLAVLAGIMEPQNVSHVTLQQMGKRYHVGDLCHKRLNAVLEEVLPETEGGLRVAGNTWKAATGGFGSTLLDSPMYVQGDDRPVTTFSWTCLNNLPALPLEDRAAMIDRIVAFPFRNHFRGEKGEDDKFAEKLLVDPSEREGILAWIVQGFVKYAKKGYRFPKVEEGRAELERRWYAPKAFLHETYSPAPKGVVTIADILDRFAAWKVRQQFEVEDLKINDVRGWVALAFPNAKKKQVKLDSDNEKKRTWAFVGIELIPDAESEP